MTVIERIKMNGRTADVAMSTNNSYDVPKYHITLYSAIGTPLREASADTLDAAIKLARRLAAFGK